ncbi:MAG: hypothetical protein IBX62_09375 [Coriobacteriia bacterium]|nr:hypothetical protein [Coriobacteriia bacterium]
MSGGIYLMSDDGLVELRESAYKDEGLLQGYLATYPHLLAGEQIDSEEPRRWLLVSREFGIPMSEQGGSQLSLDHLFLDQDAVPTLVEVKRHSDTRSRREVVAQMLDYAANSVAYIAVERMQEAFARTCQSRGADDVDVLGEFLGVEEDMDEFWERAKTNLQAGKIRLLFVCDSVAPELRRIVEYLNAHMDPTEVLAIEVTQYSGGGSTALVPRLIGQTAEAKIKKTASARTSKPWDEVTFFGDLEERNSEEEVAVARHLVDWFRSHGFSQRYGRGTRDGAMVLDLARGGHEYSLAVIWSNGYLELRFGQLMKAPPFDRAAIRNGFLEELNRVPDIELAPEQADLYPTLRLALFQDERRFEMLLTAFEWFLGQLPAE